MIRVNSPAVEGDDVAWIPSTDTTGCTTANIAAVGYTFTLSGTANYFIWPGHTHIASPVYSSIMLLIVV